MVGRKTESTTQTKTTQRRRHGETQRGKITSGQREEIMREKDGEEKILNKSKMKVNQAEEK